MVSGHIRQRFAGRCRLCGAAGKCMLGEWVKKRGSGGVRDVAGYVLRLEEVPLCLFVPREVGAMGD